MTTAKRTYDVAYINEMAEKLSNWGKWGKDDEAGALNYITPETIVQAASLVKKGKVFSCAVPYGPEGPQLGERSTLEGPTHRWNPIHTMLRDGGDVERGLFLGTDDAIYMPLQCGTQWDSLAHRFWNKKMYNNRGTELVTSIGALKNSIDKVPDKFVGRGVLLDIARYKRKRWLEGAEAIYTEDLEGAAKMGNVEVRRGDIVFIRTGQLAEVADRGEWGNYITSPAPGLSITTAAWFYEKEIAAFAVDTMGTEVLPNETEGDRKVVNQPLHSILLTRAGITIGEIFDFEALAEDCAEDGVYEFMVVAPPIPFTGAVGSPVNPIAIK